MGKPKSAKKNRKDQDDVDDDVDVDDIMAQNPEDDVEEQVHAPSVKVSKKSKKDKKKKKDEWEDDDDIVNEIAALSIGTEQNGTLSELKPSKKKKKKGRVQDEDDDDDGDEPDVVTNSSKKKPVPSFQMLMDDDDDSPVQSESDREEEQRVKVTEKNESAPSKPKKEKKKKKQKQEDDDELEALLAELDKPAVKPAKKEKKKKNKEAAESQDGEASTADGSEAKAVSIDDFDDEEYDKKKKKKKDKKEKAADDEGGKEAEVSDNEEDEEGGTVKSKAQKKKEKREREKLKKQKEKTKQKPESEILEELDKSKEPTPESGEPDKPQEAQDDEVDGEGAAKEGKKKKKKKNEKEKEEDKKDKKKSKHLAMIKAQLQMVQEEEERLKKEEDERIAREEEADNLREEKKRVEDEKRKKRKDKERERKERLREEGKLLTEKQKQDKRRSEQMLEMMKKQGFTIPAKDEGAPRKRPIYTNKKKKPQLSANRESEEKSPSPVDAMTPVVEEPPSIIEVVKAKEEIQVASDKADVKDSWDVESDGEVNDSWDKEEESYTEAKISEEKPEEKEKEESLSEEESESSEESSEEESSEDESSSEEESSEDESESEEEKDAIERAREKILKRHEKCEKERTTDVLRAPVVCVLGHVDTGKTKILDKLRRTNVQDNEAGGITQQIGATNVPKDAILNQTKMCKEFQKNELKIPGLLIIDTPGHESFSNLRLRGSSLCDIAVLVIDIMHGLEPQTIESINLLKKRKTPFLVALNKIDRLFQWKTNPTSDIQNTIKKQHPHTKAEFDERAQNIIVQLAEQSLNSALFYENKNPKEYISLVPTSAHTGDGMGNLITLICELTQTHLAKRVAYSSELQATVMEVKALPGLGMTIDVILVNGVIRDGQTIIVAGTGGPIVTHIRGLLMPEPMKELRVKNQYIHHKEVHAAQGVKIIAKDLESALAGLPMYVSHDDDETQYYTQETENLLTDVLGSIKLSERGVFVQASTIGSLEALLTYLKESKIPYAGINIGPVHKKDIIKASVMLEHETLYATILAFDVKVEREAQEHADNLGVKLFAADIIYHLFDNFMAYKEELIKQKQDEFRHIAVFPCKLKILPQYIFNSRDPIVMGVTVEAGFIKEGIPLCVPSKEFLPIGIITSIEINHKKSDIARKGTEVCIKIDPLPGDSPKMYGRHFDETDLLVSKISRDSINAVKNYFRDDMQKQDWQLILELKKLFEIL